MPDKSQAIDFVDQKKGHRKVAFFVLALAVTQAE
jgi:hypothetical protein